MRVGLYVHVPFCVRKCYYCDFYSVPAGRTPAAGDAFVSAVEREMEAVARAHAALAPLEAPTLFFGGGTPSLLSPAQLGRLLDAARRCFCLAGDAEITLEANPGTLDADKAFALRALGINRVSLGAQAFDDALLKKLGREHCAAQTAEAVALLRAAGFANLSLDLIFALPGQTLDGWLETLRRAIALRPEHLSAYGLTIEEGTPFGQWDREGKLERAPEDLEVEMMDAGIAALTAAGFEHYEISNFALPGRRSRHNQIYWHNEPYLGFGPAAASYVGGVRSANFRSLPRYLEAIGRGEPAVESSECVSREVAMGETMMLGLRLLEGVSYAEFAARYGVTPAEAYPEAVDRLAREGLVQAGGGRLALTRRGLLLASSVAAEFLP